MSQVRMDNWSTLPGLTDPYIPPEARGLRLHGIVSGHPRIDDGKPVTTSLLESIDIVNGLAMTRNTEYILGDIDPEYLAFIHETKHFDTIEKLKLGGYID